MFVAIASIVKFFKGAKIRILTEFGGDPIKLPILQLHDDPIETYEAQEIKWISERPKGAHNHHLQVDLGYADRFLAKLALGFGRVILGPQVSVSPYADELRKMLWSKKFGERESIQVRGTGPWDAEVFAHIGRFISWPGVWSLFFNQAGDSFGLILGTPQGRHMSIVLSDDPSLWHSEHLEVHRGGALYLIVPQRERVFGPIPAVRLIGHLQGHRKHPDLVAVEALRTDPADIPSYERPPTEEI